MFAKIVYVVRCTTYSTHNVLKEINILDILQVFVTLQNEKLHCHQPIIVSVQLQNRQFTVGENAEKKCNLGKHLR